MDVLSMLSFTNIYCKSCTFLAASCKVVWRLVSSHICTTQQYCFKTLLLKMDYYWQQNFSGTPVRKHPCPSPLLGNLCPAWDRKVLKHCHKLQNISFSPTCLLNFFCSFLPSEGFPFLFCILTTSLEKGAFHNCLRMKCDLFCLAAGLS